MCGARCLIGRGEASKGARCPRGRDVNWARCLVPLYTHLTQYDVLPEYTKNTRSYIMTYTDHDRRLYNQYRSLPATLYTFYTIMYGSSEYTKNTRSCTMT